MCLCAVWTSLCTLCIVLCDAQAFSLASEFDSHHRSFSYTFLVYTPLFVVGIHRSQAHKLRVSLEIGVVEHIPTPDKYQRYAYFLHLRHYITGSELTIVRERTVKNTFLI